MISISYQLLPRFSGAVGAGRRQGGGHHCPDDLSCSFPRAPSLPTDGSSNDVNTSRPLMLHHRLQLRCAALSMVARLPPSLSYRDTSADDTLPRMQRPRRQFHAISAATIPPRPYLSRRGGPFYRASALLLRPWRRRHVIGTVGLPPGPWRMRWPRPCLRESDRTASPRSLRHLFECNDAATAQSPRRRRRQSAGAATPSPSPPLCRSSG